MKNWIPVTKLSELDETFFKNLIFSCQNEWISWDILSKTEFQWPKRVNKLGHSMKNQPLLTNIYELAETFYEKSSSCEQNVWISLENL